MTEPQPTQAPAFPEVHGATVDAHTRCRHYHTALDIVAIRFACCGEYYPCWKCHEEYADHPIKVWPADAFDTRAILCGMCGHELTITEYLPAECCPHCGARFNPRCHAHAHLYFEVPPAG